MSNTSSFSFTNKVVNAVDVAPFDLKPVTNYAKITDEPTIAVLSNKTAALDQGELLTYRANELSKVSTSQTLQHPLPIRNGVQYVIKVEEILRTVDAAGVIIGDEPIVAYVTIRHQKSGNISTALVDEVFKRAVGACYKTDGTTRFTDLMRSALIPTVD